MVFLLGCAQVDGGPRDPIGLPFLPIAAIPCRNRAEFNINLNVQED
jgi:hypothetical protein